MNANPGYWQDYYSGTDNELQTLKIYSYSDRIRYYWADPKVNAAVSALYKSLEANPLPETISSQAFMGLEFGEMPTTPDELVKQHVQRCIGRYFKASGH